MSLFTSAVILSRLVAPALAGSHIEGAETQILLNQCVEPVLQ